MTNSLTDVGLWAGMAAVILTVASGGAMIPLTTPLAAVGLAAALPGLHRHVTNAGPAVILNAGVLLPGLLIAALALFA